MALNWLLEAAPLGPGKPLPNHTRIAGGSAAGFTKQPMC